MARSQESFGKKEREKKKRKKQKDKLERREERKAASSKGKTLEDQFSYVDEDGNLTDTPPDPSKRKKIKAEDIAVSVPKQEPSEEGDHMRTGRITFFNDSKGFGFIRDDVSQESVFVHISSMEGELRENTRVTFRVARDHKGLSAVNVRAV